jgi:hypothetical protein
MAKYELLSWKELQTELLLERRRVSQRQADEMNALKLEFTSKELELIGKHRDENDELADTQRAKEDMWRKRRESSNPCKRKLEPDSSDTCIALPPIPVCKKPLLHLQQMGDKLLSPSPRLPKSTEELKLMSVRASNLRAQEMVFFSLYSFISFIQSNKVIDLSVQEPKLVGF